MNSLLNILGCLIFAPYIVQLVNTHWDKNTWSRQLLLSILSLQLCTFLFIPSVMYICTGLLCVTTIIYAIHSKPKFQTTTFLILACLYLVWYAISLLWSAAPKKGCVFIIDNCLPMLIFAMLSALLQINHKELTTLFKTFCYSALIFIILSIICWVVTCVEIKLMPWEWPFVRKQSVNGLPPYKWVFRFLGGTNGYTHPSYNLLSLFVAAGFSTWLKHKKLISPIVWWVIWVGSVVLTLMVQSRMSIIYAGIVLLGYILYGITNRKLQITCLLSILILGCTTLAVTHNFWKEYGKDAIRNTLSAYTWRYIQLKPLIGAGAGALNPIEICHTIGEHFWPNIGIIDPNQEVADWPYKMRMLPHNQLLADWAHAGLPAALIVLSLYILVFIESWRKKCYWAGIYIIILSVFSYLEPPLYIGKGLYMFCTITCLLSAYLPDKNKTT